MPNWKITTYSEEQVADVFTIAGRTEAEAVGTAERLQEVAAADYWSIQIIGRDIEDIGERCTDCGCDCSFGSGRFVDRVSSFTASMRGYLCPECQEIDE